MPGPDIDQILRILKREVRRFDTPVVDMIEADTHDPYKVLVSTMLSARTKDEVTEAASERLFSRAGTPQKLGRLSLKEIEDLIRPVNFYKTKALRLKSLPAKLSELGGVPNTIDELVSIPGVGRKTANLVVSVAFRKPGICVDTHVHRIMNRLGYVRTRSPLETEMALRRKLPGRHWLTVNSMLVAFGQNICRPVSPKCPGCPVFNQCRRVGVGCKMLKSKASKGTCRKVK